MNRNFIFVFILLVTLSVINAAPFLLGKRDPGFTTCSPPPGGPVPILISVDYTPDPLVSGQSSKFDTPVNPVPIASFPTYSDTFTGEIIKAGNPFKTTVQLTVPPLPNSYTVGALIENSKDDIPGCAYKWIGAPPSSLSSYPIASYPIAEK
ncbi:hypothetical protein Glove_299g82 [Diversispora epigaea]|uniref:MD-2-related lipid-recognition domain-containing protein n=1 Tax=Diversispora epigaea TaxID=1348612 RepID=A0A397HWY8_9GLOM|nr:hypothetical protein Glove_299g82 [Diversispora epigaea]